MFTLFAHFLQTLWLSQLIENHIAKEHSQRYFYSPLLLTSKQTSPLDHHIADYIARKQWKSYCFSRVHLVCSFLANVVVKSADRKSHREGTFTKILLFTSFAHFKANVPTRSADRRLHAKGTVYTRMPFSCFTQLEANVATRSADQRLHCKGTLMKILLFTFFAHFEANAATRSSYRRLHSKKTVKKLLLFACSPYLLISCKRCG